MGVKKSYGAVGRGDTLSFEPETLKVITDPKHPLYDPRVLREPTEAMILSIMRQGIITPVVITRDGEDVYVVDGRQRRASTIEANKRLKAEGGEPILIPCVWSRGDEAKLYEVSVTANEVRSGDSPLERAKKMQHLMSMGRDDKQVAVAFGCTLPTVHNSLALLECAASVKSAVESGQLPATIATKLSKLTREEQDARLKEMIAAGATKGAAGTKAATQQKGGKVESKRKALGRGDQAKVLNALDNIDHKELATRDANVVLAVKAAFAFIAGDSKAFKEWPDVAEIVASSLKPKEKKAKEPKVKKAKNKKSKATAEQQAAAN